MPPLPLAELARTATDRIATGDVAGLKRDLSTYVEHWAAASVSKRDTLTSAIEVLLGTDAAADTLLLSFLFDLSKNPEYYHRLYRTVFVANLPLYQRYTAFLYLEYLLFTNQGAFSAVGYDAARDRLHADYQQLVEAVEQDLVGVALTPRPPGAVVALLMHAFHDPAISAPSWDVLDYGRHLAASFARAPVLINTNCTVHTLVLPFWPLVRATMPKGAVISQPGQSFQHCPWPIEHDSVPTVHLPQRPLDRETLIWTLREILALAPAYAFAYTDRNLIADLLARWIPVYTMHYTSNVPIRRYTRVCYVDRPDETNRRQLDRLGLAESLRVRVEPTFTLQAESRHYTRAEYGLSDQDFVVLVIGARLNQELTPPFLAMLETLTVSEPSLRVLFAGHFDNHRALLAPAPTLAARAVIAGFVKDVRSLSRLGNGYLNPDRVGGGTSAVYALSVGIPVFSLPRGDVSFNVGERFLVADYPAMIAAVSRLMRDPNWRAELRAEALARVGEISDRTLNLRRIEAHLDPFSRNGVEFHPK
ncbi:hypothetical protein WCLP8_5150014 [uncultured Gammaproteobacteria bacterium]